MISFLFLEHVLPSQVKPLVRTQLSLFGALVHTMLWASFCQDIYESKLFLSPSVDIYKEKLCFNKVN